jgi:RNA polymerase sigma factor (sigma-70 family)
MKKLIKCKDGVIKELTLEETINEFEGILKGKDVTKWFRYYDKDDLIQMAYMGLIKAYNYYDVSKNMSFASYGKNVVLNHLTYILKTDNRIKRGRDFEICSYNITNEEDETESEMIDNIKDDNVNCEESALKNIEKERIFNLVKSLSVKEQELINLYFIKGLTYQEIGDLYNKTRQCIQVRVKNLINKLKLRLEVAV